MSELTSAVTAVTVYPDRARITRTGALALEPGQHLIEVADLPLQMDEDSVRAAVRGTGRSRLLGVQVRRSYFSETPAETARELETKIEGIQETLSQLDARAAQLQQYHTVLDSLSGHTEIFATALAAGETNVVKQLELFDALRARASALDEEGRSLARERRTEERLLQKLQNELKQQRSARPRERYSARIEVEVLKGGDFTFELIYVVAGAAWKPLYDIRLIEEKEQPSLEVSYLAQVNQQTGEAWENVALTLSTARPALAAILPELSPWFIQPRPVPPPMMMRSAAAQGFQGAPPAPASLSASTDFMAEELKEIEAEPMTATVDASGAAVSYSIPVAVSIPTDGDPHKVPVARFPLEPRLDYTVAPGIVAAAYRRARAENDSPYVLLPGVVNLFAGDEFIGATTLELTAPKGEIELYLGVDDRLKVEREMKRREADKRLIGGQRVMRYGYEITLENLLSIPAQMTVHDQIPVARVADIKVKLDVSDPKPTEQTELNLLKWEFSLAPKEKRLIRFDFTVESPRGLDVIGLP